MKLHHALLVMGALLAVEGPALAWGDLGHQVTALIAYRHLTAPARVRLDALLEEIPILSPRRTSPVAPAGPIGTATRIARLPPGITSTWKSIIRI
jgi:hypothetical protein